MARLPYSMEFLMPYHNVLLFGRRKGVLLAGSLSDILENTCAYLAARPGTPALIGCYRFVQHLITCRLLVESSTADLPSLAEIRCTKKKEN